MNNQALETYVAEELSDIHGYSPAYRAMYVSRLQELIAAIQAEELKGTKLQDLILVGVDHEDHEIIILPRLETDHLGVEDLVLTMAARAWEQAHGGITIDVYGPGLEYIIGQSIESMDIFEEDEEFINW